VNSVGNLKSTQLRELIIIFKSSVIRNFNIFGAREGFLFEFETFNGIWKFGGILLPGRAYQSAAQWVLTTRASHRTHATRHWPGHHAVTVLAVVSAQAPVTASHRHCPCRGGPYPTQWRVSSPFPFLLPRHFYSAPHRPPLCPPLPAAIEPPLSCPTGPKEAPHHRAPPAPGTCPRRRLTKSANGSSPTVVFLREHPTGGSLLWLFPNPATSSAQTRSSSQTTSSIASTTPPVPPRRRRAPH
jgi:hypothetical protein